MQYKYNYKNNNYKPHSWTPFKYDEYDKKEIIDDSEYIYLITQWKHKRVSKPIEHKQLYSDFSVLPFTATEHFDVKGRQERCVTMFFSKYSLVQFTLFL